MLSHLKLADDITLIAREQDKLQSMIEELNEKSEEIGLKINSTKTKYLTNDIYQNQHTITINNRPAEKVESYIYLGRKIEIIRNNLTANLSRRISLAWSAFGRMQDVFKFDIPNRIKARILTNMSYRFSRMKQRPGH